MNDWTSSSGHVVIERAGGAAVVRIDRPDKLNALTVPMLKDLGSALSSLAEPGEHGGIVLTGTGRAFSAGDDLPATEDLSESDFEELLSSFQDLTRVLLRTQVPVVAALNGIAVGGAAELTLACDARIGGPTSEFLFPENDVGLTISNASTYLLPRIVGARAISLVLDARRTSAEQAHSMGLIDHMVATPEEVLPAAVALVERWTTRGLATRFHLQMLRPDLDEVERAIERENAIGRAAWEAGTAKAGIRRFLEEQRARRS